MAQQLSDTLEFNMILAISIKKNKTKIVLFKLYENKTIEIYYVQLFNKFILTKKIKKELSMLLIDNDITNTVISIYDDYPQDRLQDLTKKLNIIGLNTENIVSYLFTVAHALKYVNNNKLKTIGVKLRYIKNGWLDFSDKKHIDINGLVLYMKNNIQTT